MLLSAIDIACVLSFALLAGVLALHSGRRATAICLILACGVTALWALADALAISGGPASSSRLLATLDVARLAAWVAFLTAAFATARADLKRSPAFVLAVAGGSAGAGLLGANAAGLFAPWRPRGFDPAQLYGLLSLAIVGLVLVEALLRRARAEGHDRTRYLCLGVGAVLTCDVLTWSQALLFPGAEATLLGVRPAVSLLAAPLLGVGASRNQAWATELNLARRAVIHSATLFVTGMYLLSLAAAAAWLRETGGHLGPSLQAVFLVVGGLALALVWASPSARTALRFHLSRYLFTHRHDYREQWERFTSASAAGDASTRVASMLRALADVIGSHWAALWLRDGDAFVLAAAQGIEAAAVGEIPEGPFTAWVEARHGEACTLEGAPADLPAGLHWGWVLIPLVRDRLAGFAVLSRPRGRASLHREDADVLRSAGLHAASALLADQRARRLSEVQRFEEVSRGLAFVAHDLRNVANELNLTLANARRHIARPDFQRDLILSMEESVRSMQTLLDKVARRRLDTLPTEPVDLVQMVRGTVRMRRAAETRLALEHAEGETLPIVCEPEQLAAMSGHLIQNAMDAAGAKGRVSVRLRREGDDALLEVEDDGDGLPSSVLRDRLRHPFQSSKATGFGLGLFECRELAKQLGGEFTMDSAPGRGTIARLRLPLATAGGGAPGGSRAGA